MNTGRFTPLVDTCCLDLFSEANLPPFAPITLGGMGRTLEETEAIDLPCYSTKYPM